MEDGFWLADKLGQSNPFEMLEVMPQPVFQYWKAYWLLRDDDYREKVQWASLGEKEFEAEQNTALKGIIHSGKAIAERRAGR